MSLFDEIPSPPESYELEIDENGTVISQKISLDDQIVLARYFKFFAVMDLPTAKAIADYFGVDVVKVLGLDSFQILPTSEEEDHLQPERPPIIRVLILRLLRVPQFMHQAVALFLPQDGRAVTDTQ